MNKMFTSFNSNHCNQNVLNGKTDIAKQIKMLRARSRNAWSVSLVAMFITIVAIWCIPMPESTGQTPEEIIHEVKALDVRSPLPTAIIVTAGTVAAFSTYVGVKTLRSLYKLLK